MPDAEIERADMRRLGRWDSLALLTLLARIEKEFGLALSAEQFNQFTSYATIRELLGPAMAKSDSAAARIDGDTWR